MDIQKNRYLQHHKLKRFTLTSIATAILSMNTEVASATSCPVNIVGTALAGELCEFDLGTGLSVTVKNGGVVGGIGMISYFPTSSSIIIDAGGTIDNNGLGSPAISINSSSLSNGILNNGTISALTTTGIAISSTSNISGGISNSGSISTGSIGISVGASVVNGGILNSGTFTTNGTGILITSQSTISGGITNTGTINTSGVFVGVTVSNSSIVIGSISNSGLIVADSGDGILTSNSIINGDISNSGTIQSTNNTGISLRNVATIQGNITNSSIISAANYGIAIRSSSLVIGSIINSGSISGNNNGISLSTGTISGNITNSGTITGATGIATTSATITGGISNSGIIQGNINAINIDSNSNVSNIDILGQNARIIGAVIAPNTNFNITSDSTFTSEGNYNVNTFNVATNATFTMANNITANSVSNSGILAANTTQTITGDYTQQTSGTFQTNVASASQYGKLVVTGTADLSASGKVNIQIAPNATLREGDVLTDIISGNTIITPIGGYAVTDNSLIWKFVATNTFAGGFNLIATLDPSAQAVCQGLYCQGAANTIIGQVAAGNSAFNPYGAIATENEFMTVASQATPELTNENIPVLQWITKAVMDIVPIWSILHGKVEDTRWYQPGKVWIKPYSASLIQDVNATVQGYHATAYGVVFGEDVQVTEDWLLGGAIAIGKDNLRGKSVLSSQSIYSDVYQGIAYAARKLQHNLYFAAQGLLGYANNDTNRSIPLYASTATGSYDSWFTNLRAQLGWNAYAHQNLSLTPSVDASYIFINQSSYQESGSVMNLKVGNNNHSSLILGAYGNGAYRLTTLSNQQDLILTGYAGLARDVLNNQPHVTATFVAGGPSFSTYGVEFNKTVFRGGIGLAFDNPGKPLRVNLNYDVQTGNNAYSGVGSLTVAYKL